MDVQSLMKAPLLAILILSAVTWLSHMYSCIKIFMESLPSVVSAVIAPNESKLARRRSKLQKTSHATPARNEDMLQDNQKHEDVVLADVLLPAIIRESKQEHESSKMVMVIDQDKDAQVGNDEDVAMSIVVHEERETSVVNRGVKVNPCEDLVLHNINEVYDGLEEGVEHESELHEEVSGEVEGENDLPPADELNQRVEDFIARFNMERKLEEARMLVSCY
ncbi:hypothetical protein HU200_058227 [Digitaria exilis]|uniref:Uncharacterized protein n=1 Tax=Digitaria exilis TaxID=1010633 RepID=A0A835E0R7_9POAL|nr:hypothetical protein HU200_058227 [Digitaria exilis]